MNPSTRELNVALYNQIIALIDQASAASEDDDHAAALLHLEAAGAIAGRLPIVDSTDVLMAPQILLRRAEVLLDLEREVEALETLRTAHFLIDRLVQQSTGEDPEFDAGVGALTSHLSDVALAVDTEFAQTCLDLDYHQATRVAALAPSSTNAQLRLLSAVGRFAEAVAGASPRHAVDLMEPALPVARWLARVAADDVAAIANASAFVLNVARLKAAAGILAESDLAAVDEFVVHLERLGDRGDAAQRAASLRMLRQVCVTMQERASSARAESRDPGPQPPHGPLVRGRVTLTGAPQRSPEALGQGDRRARLYEYVKGVVATTPQGQASAVGRPLGDGAGMEELVQLIEPIFHRERSLLRWVALRGALTVVSQMGEEAWFEAFPNMVGLEFYQDHLADQVGFRFRDRSSGLGTHIERACAGLCAKVLACVLRYDDIVKMPVQEVNANTDHATRGFINDAMALDIIAWVATAELRLEAVVGGSFLAKEVPQPSMLETPGWHVEPLFSKGERYWDGTDWTPWVRLAVDGEYYTSTVGLR